MPSFPHQRTPSAQGRDATREVPFARTQAKRVGGAAFSTSKGAVPAALAETAALGWRLSHSPPPYVEELPLPTLPRRPRRYSILILDIEVLDRDAVQGLDGVVGDLRRKFVMPVFGRLGEASTDAEVLRLRAALAVAGGEFLPLGEDIGRRAREVLTIRPNLASDWLRWHRLHRQIGLRQEEAIRALVSHSGTPIPAGRILAEAGMSARSARRWLAGAHLPQAAAWARANRVLRALLTLQRDPELHPYDAAIAAGYSSSEAFSNAVFRYFGHAASKGRRLLGLERRFREFDRRYSRLRSQPVSMAAGDVETAPGEVVPLLGNRRR